MRKKAEMFNFENIKPTLTRTFGRTSLQVQKYSPEILTTVGVIGVVAAGVMASRATLKLSPILEEKNTNLKHIKELRERPDADEVYPKGKANEDTAKTYYNTAVGMLRLYGPSVTLGLASIACIVGAQGIMKKRNVALVAAYKTVESAFSEYRERIKEELGEEVELDLFRNRVEEEVTDEETGEKKKVIREHPEHSPYAKVFGELSNVWQNNADYNLTFLRGQETYFNELLHARGHVFLNEVYDVLDIPRTQAGQMVGWVRGNGDDFIDFGIYDDINNPQKAAFINGLESGILLDFNVDGPIMDLI